MEKCSQGLDCTCSFLALLPCFHCSSGLVEWPFVRSGHWAIKDLGSRGGLRVDGGGAMAAASRLDDEVLWSASGTAAAAEEDQRKLHDGSDVGPRLDQPQWPTSDV